MRGRFIIILCLLNLCIAGGLIWFVLHKKTERTGLLPQATAEPLSDEECWSRATEAQTSREAYHYLAQIEDSDALSETIGEAVTSLLSGLSPAFDHWPFYQAMLQMHGKQASSQDELLPLAQIAESKIQSLTLRDTAFRSYIENAKRMSEGNAMSQDSLRLIDMLFEESNSLAETALQAEHFLTKDEEPGAGPGGRFTERLRATLLDTGQLEATRITALSILSEKDALAELPLARIYSTAGVRLQTSLLRMIDGMDPDTATRLWLEGVAPLTPEQEQLLANILDQKS